VLCVVGGVVYITVWALERDNHARVSATDSGVTKPEPLRKEEPRTTAAHTSPARPPKPKKDEVKTARREEAPTDNEENDQPPDALTAQVLERINSFRSTAGVAAVGVDLDLCRGCSAHARYLAQNLGDPALRHGPSNHEDEELPGYSAEGALAARVSLTAIGRKDAATALDAWMATLFFRLALLDGELRRIGFGHARHPAKGLIAVLDVTRGRGSKRVRLYPVPGQKNVPLTYPGNEVPDPIPQARIKRAGYPITATFPATARVHKVTTRLTDAAGNDLAIWLSSPEQPAYKPTYQFNTVCVIAKQPLHPESSYRIEIRAEVAEKPWRRTWEFRTAKSDAALRTEADGNALVILNAYRKTAGVPPLRPDSALARACQLHAEYLVRNFGDPSLQGLGVHDEKPNLPGYTPEGRQAARRSVIYQGSNPADAVDGWVHSFFHRIPVLSPEAGRAGYGQAKSRAESWFAVLVVQNGTGDDRPTLYPAPGQKQVPLGYFPAERPSPVPAGADTKAGYPITLTFPDRTAVKGVTARLTQDGREVPRWLSTPEKPVHPQLQHNSICVLPQAVLEPKTTYTVSVTAQVAGKKWSQSWSFTTGAADSWQKSH
jgi:uncharacterized protein YkwD